MKVRSLLVVFARYFKTTSQNTKIVIEEINNEPL